MQMVHMERACRQDETPEDTKKAYTRVIEGSVDGEVVKVFVQQCFENAHPEEAARKPPQTRRVPLPRKPRRLSPPQRCFSRGIPGGSPRAEKQATIPEETQSSRR